MVGTEISLTRQRGLTLVELLVVIAILALASSAVLLSAPPRRPPVRDDAERFAARVQLAFDEMIASGRIMRIAVKPSGYEFQVFSGSDWRAIEGEKIFSPEKIDNRTTISPEMIDAANANMRALGVEEALEDDNGDNEREDESMQTVPLDPLGAQVPFSVMFSSADGAWLVNVDEGANVTVREDAGAR